MPTKHAPATSLDVIEAFLHAADAYPKLVEALRAIIDAGELAPVNAGRDVADKIAEECATSRALLADLGED